MAQGDNKLPTTTTGGIFYGVKLSVIIAGFLGGVIAMTFVRQLSRTQMTMAVATGTVTTHYLTPLAIHYSNIAVDLESGIAFLIGIMAMNIIPGFLRLSEAFSTDPRSFLFPKSKGGVDDDTNGN